MFLVFMQLTTVFWDWYWKIISIVDCWRYHNLPRLAWYHKLMEFAENLFKIFQLRSMVKVQVDESTGWIEFFHHFGFFQDPCLLMSNNKNFNVVDLRLQRSKRDLETSLPSNYIGWPFVWVIMRISIIMFPLAVK